MNELSGPRWVGRFPTSTSTADLAGNFRIAADGFIGALRLAGALVKISATYRPPQRAYLMHYAWAIDRSGADPSKIPPMAGVDIDWVHRKADGTVDLAASRAAARGMVAGYGIVHGPALRSRHTERLAIDMNITWVGNLVIVDGGGRSVAISSAPRTGAGNVELRAVGASYGLRKLASDPPHWSNDGH